MALRNSSTDAGRKGAPSQTKAKKAAQMPRIPHKGHWGSAYSGRGYTPEAPPGQEVGVDRD